MAELCSIDSPETAPPTPTPPLALSPPQVMAMSLTRTLHQACPWIGPGHTDTTCPQHRVSLQKVPCVPPTPEKSGVIGHCVVNIQTGVNL